MKKTIVSIIILCGLVLGAFAITQKTESPAQTGQVTQLTADDFVAKVGDFRKNPQGWTIISKKPVLIDFYATWCGPCRQLAPIVERMAEEYKGQITVYKVDVDKQPELAKYFDVRALPTLAFIPVEGKIELSQGYMSESVLDGKIQQVLLGDKSK